MLEFRLGHGPTNDMHCGQLPVFGVSVVPLILAIEMRLLLLGVFVGLNNMDVGHEFRWGGDD